MKKLLILTMIILGTVSFARGGSPTEDREGSFRDYEYNERRDIVEPMEENLDRLSRFSPLEWQESNEVTEENFKKYEDFHKDLARSDQGENSER